MANIQPKLKIIRNNITGKRYFKYQLPVQDIDKSVYSATHSTPTYYIMIPNEGFRKNFNANELWYQMKMYSDRPNVKVNGVVQLLDAEKNTIAEYNSNSIYDKTLQVDTKRYYMDNKKLHCQILSDEYISRTGYFHVAVVDDDGVVQPNKTVYIEITKHGDNDWTIQYEKITDSNGVAHLIIRLLVGEYTFRCRVRTKQEDNSYVEESIPVSKDIEVIDKPLTLEFDNGSSDLNDVNKRELFISTNSDIKKGTSVHCLIYDGGDNPVSGAEITYNIHGLTYKRVSDENGDTGLPINLNKGRYDLKCTHTYTDETGVEQTATVTQNIRVEDKRDTGIKLYKNYLNVAHKYDKKTKKYIDVVSIIKGTGLDLQLYDKETGDPLPNKTVVIKTSGKTYTPKTDYNGVARLRVILNRYSQLTYQFNGDDCYNKCENTITSYIQPVASKKCGLEVLNHENKYAHCTLNGYLTVRLHESTTKKYKGIQKREVKFTFDNNTSKTVTTDWLGDAVVSLNGLSKGEHKVTCVFDGDYYFNKTTKSFTINITAPTDSRLNIASKVQITPEDTVTVKLTTSNYEPISNEAVVCRIGDDTYTATTNNNGEASFDFNLMTGEHNAVFSYEGNSTYHNRAKNVNTLLKVVSSIDNTELRSKHSYRSLIKLHLNIPEAINDKVAYIMFLFYITPTEVTKEGDNYYTKLTNVYFNDFMINLGSEALTYSENVKDYQTVTFTNTYYSLLYPHSDVERGAEIIRPSRKSYTVDTLTSDEYTVIAPFDEPDVKEDRPEYVCTEYLNFHDQDIRLTQGE